MCRLKESATDISFHPETNLIAVANIQGELSVFEFDNEVGGVKRLKQVLEGVSSKLV